FLFARQNRAGTRRTSDAGIPLRVKRVDGNAVLLRVGVHLRGGPVRERADAEAAVYLFHLEDAGSCRGLLPSKARRPGTELAKLRLQRVNLPNLAAQVAILHAF